MEMHPTVDALAALVLGTLEGEALEQVTTHL
jgi:hypothetical protein